METRNVSGEVLSNEVFEDRNKLVESFKEKLDEDDVATIKVTKDIKITDQRVKVVNKQIRKLTGKLNVLQDELNKG